MSTEMSTFAEKVSLLRRKGYKVNEIAEKLGVSRQFLQKLVTGKAHIPVDKQAIIDNLLTDVDEEVDTQCQPPGLADLVASLSDVVSRLDRLERILLDVLARLPPAGREGAQVTHGGGRHPAPPP